MKMIKLITGIVVVAAMGCAEPNYKVSNGDARELYRADPISDANAAIVGGDYRFIGINGYSVQVPELKMQCLNLDSDIKLMDGTTEFVTSYEEEKFNALAHVYATNYNQHLLAYLSENGLFTCNSSDD